MTARTSVQAAVAAVALLAAVGAAQAGLPFTHPAIARSADAPVVIAAVQARDASPALVGHPASPQWIAVHANHEHPAVTQARLAQVGAVDANTFLVQPPASVRWTMASGADLPSVQVAQVQR
ncbi:MAG: hypothetical protein AB9M60_10465 [Leptothrix sp. (in: b-proteobacteria)]